MCASTQFTILVFLRPLLVTRALEIHSEIILMTQLQHSMHLTERGRNAAVAFVNRPNAAPALQRLEY